MNHIIILVGLEPVGVNFAREFGRFLASYKKNSSIQFIMIDEKEVEEADLEVPLFLKEDLGWNRAATLKMILESQFTNSVGIKAFSFNLAKEEKSFFRKVNLNFSDTTMLFVDCAQDKLATKAIMHIYGRRKNAIAFHASKTGIQVQHRMDGKPVAKKVRKFDYSKPSYEHSLTLSNILLAQICNIITDGVTSKVRNVYMQQEHFFYHTKKGKDSSYNMIPVPKGKNTGIVCIGTGGTGGNFVKMAVHTLRAFSYVNLLLVDGDKVEEKNRVRQPFGENDVLENKASILCENLVRNYPKIEEQVVVFPEYIKDTTDLERISQGYDNLVLVGCVDNHRARQIMHKFFAEKENIVYIDSANEFSVGEVVISVKTNGVQHSPLRSDYYPDVLTDNSPAAYEMSCGAMNESAPQHQVTNLTAATILFNLVEELLRTESIRSGIVYFNAFQYFCRFQPVEKGGTVNGKND